MYSCRSRDFAGRSGVESMAGFDGEGHRSSAGVSDRQVSSGLRFWSGRQSWLFASCSCSSRSCMGAVPVRLCRVCGGCRGGASRRFWCSKWFRGDDYEPRRAGSSGGSARGHAATTFSKCISAGEQARSWCGAGGGEEAKTEEQVCGSDCKECSLDAFSLEGPEVAWLCCKIPIWMPVW